MERTKERLLYLIREQYPDECFILGDKRLEKLTQECLDGRTEEEVRKACQDTGGGFKFDLVTTITLVFAAIETFKTALDIIDRYEERTEEKKTTYDIALKALLDNGVDIEVAKKYCDAYYPQS